MTPRIQGISLYVHIDTLMVLYTELIIHSIAEDGSLELHSIFYSIQHFGLSHPHYSGANILTCDVLEICTKNYKFASFALRMIEFFTKD
jgi:hypothetical protein